MALDRALTLRASRVCDRAEWTLPRIIFDAAGSLSLYALPGPLTGNGLFAEYENRKHSRFDHRKPDRLLPHKHEARISRHVGFKSVYGGATVIYWDHIPIARFAANTQNDTPHIYLTGYHLTDEGLHGRVKGRPLHAYKALNPLLDYLMTGVRCEADGVHIYRPGGDKVTPWPKTAVRPALFIPVAGRKLPVPYWTATGVEFVSNRSVCRIGGETWEEPVPWGHT